MTCGIYCIKNNINGKMYIGQSIVIEKRKQQHFAQLRHNNHDNTYLQNAFNKHGEDAFEFKIIKACKPRYLNRFEKLYIKIYDSYKNGYNLTEGGENPPTFKGENHPQYGCKHSQKERIIMSKSRNTCGYYRVSQRKASDCIQGFRWRYQYRTDDGINKSITSVDINKLEEKVKSKGLPWYKLKD